MIPRYPHLQTQAYGALFPVEGEIHVNAITTASAAWQLTGTTTFSATDKEKMITFVSDVDVYLVFGDSGVVALETAVTGDTQCILLPAYCLLTGRLPLDEADPLYVAMKGVAAGYMRAWVSSVP